MIVDVNAPRDGIVFFSETYYPDRRAWVDGTRIPRMKVDLAFTAVRVPAGTHRIELQGPLPAADNLSLPFPMPPRRIAVSATGWDVAARQARPR